MLAPPLLAAALAAGIAPAAPEIRVLLLGNSHTHSNDIPSTLNAMLKTDGSGRKVFVKSFYGAFLDDLAGRSDVVRSIKTEKWTFVVLQGAKLSSSHKYSYSQQPGIDLAILSQNYGAKPLLFAEWPRRGWSETNYILGIYGSISKETGAKILPIPNAWDAALAKNPGLPLYSPDGNHASPLGSYLASCVIYYRVAGTGRDPKYRPENVQDASQAEAVRTAARAAAAKA